MESNNKKVVIVGAGVSGLLACKHCVEQGLSPVVFEAESHVGGVWSHTLESTKLQTPKTYYQFSDFPWPHSLQDTLFPDHASVVDYLTSYASHFDLLSRINFNAKVNSLDYSHSTATWTVTVRHAHSPSVQVYEAEFVILCIGNFSGLANTPKFPANEGPEVFDGVAIHAMDFSAMDDKAASQLLAGKRVVVVGYQKSALDLATEAANLNGAERPCRLVHKTVHWTVPEHLTAFMFRGLSRFSEMMVHQPRESFLRSLSVTLFFSPLLWVFSKMVETYLRTVYPLNEYDLVPSHSFAKQMFTCTTPTTPPRFFERLRQGSIVPIKLRSPNKQLRFCKTGLIVDDHNALSADIVVLATGYKPDQKLQNIFSSSFFKECLATSSPPFYRDCIHPRIPKVGIMGYADSPASLFATEMRSKWLAHYLAGKFELPSVAEMEQDSATWEKCTKRYAGADYRRYCAPPLLQIYTNDLLCNDMGINPHRKSCFLADFFAPYAPTDYNF